MFAACLFDRCVLLDCVFAVGRCMLLVCLMFGRLMFCDV